MGLTQSCIHRGGSRWKRSDDSEHSLREPQHGRAPAPSTQKLNPCGGRLRTYGRQYQLDIWDSYGKGNRESVRLGRISRLHHVGIRCICSRDDRGALQSNSDHLEIRCVSPPSDLKTIGAWLQGDHRLRSDHRAPEMEPFRIIDAVHQDQFNRVQQ